MKPSIQHGSRSVIGLAFRPSFTNRTVNAPTAAHLSRRDTFVCHQCSFRAVSTKSPREQIKQLRKPYTFFQSPVRIRSRTFADTPSGKPVDEPSSTNPQRTSAQADTIPRVPDEILPSHREGQRWHLTKKFSSLMEELQAKIGIATQKVNNYTGTDYSGIEALRREIAELEKLVKTRAEAIHQAKSQLDEALGQQASAQKEVVALLERKHSWSATDLERYMSLIRSEHVNDQGVHSAKEKVAAAEQALEEARSHLEKRERMRYHEEQIWSDTIRRNSTWVTFGLMGANILLLLTQLVVVEPWRRKRLVREIKTALDEKAPAMGMVAPTSDRSAEADIDHVVEPAGVSLDSLEKWSPKSISASAGKASLEGDPELAQVSDFSQELLTDDGASPTSGDVPLALAQVTPSQLTTYSPTLREQLSKFFAKPTLFISDLFSKRRILIRKVDLTSAALEGVIFGASLCGIFVFIWKSR